MGDVRFICTADSLCGSHAGQHNYQLFVVAVKSHPSVLNIRRSLSAPRFKGRVWGFFGTAACRPIVPLPPMISPHSSPEAPSTT